MLSDHPAILLVGPRASGKTTTARRHAISSVDLSRPAERAVIEADPDAALSGRPTPLLIDEWQEAPSVLGAIKRSIDDDPARGRFVITGSARADLDTVTWPGTGRLVRLTMYGVSERERRGRLGQPWFLDRLAGSHHFERAGDQLDLGDYVDLALSGGFPEPVLRLQGRAREEWFDSYVDQLLTRDALELEPRRDPVRLRRYLRAYALNSASVVDETSLLQASELNRRTADAYRRLLQNLYVIEELPAWTSNRLRRLSLAPKRHVVDSGLLTALLDVDRNAVMSDGGILGRLLETFVTAQLRAEIDHVGHRVRLHHLRQQDGRHEIDLIAELAGGKVLAIEIKATASPDRDDARHLVWLRDQLGDRFLSGAVLHTGPAPIELHDRILALPIAAIWS